MLVKLAFYAPSNSRFTPKTNAQIMLDSQNNATLVPENALFYFKQLLLYIYILFVYF